MPPATQLLRAVLALLGSGAVLATLVLPSLAPEQVGPVAPAVTATTAATSPTAAPAPKGIVFTDTREVVINTAQLQAQGGKIIVQLRNADPDGIIQVQLTLLGLATQSGATDSVIESSRPKGPSAPVNIAGRRTEQAELVFSLDELKKPPGPVPGNYQGVLLAEWTRIDGAGKPLQGALGEPLQRTFTLRVPGAILDEQRDKVTLTGVAYWPSVFQPVVPSVFWVGGIGVLLLWLFLLGARWREALKRFRDWFTSGATWIRVGTFGLVAGLVLLAMGMGIELSRRPDWKEPVTLASQRLLDVPARGGIQLGTVSSADGTIGRVVRDGNQIRVQDLVRAGKYEGKLSLQPGTEGAATAPVIALIADWWIWAVGTIAVGVLAGYLVTRYFRERRGVMRQRIRAAELWRQVVDAENRFQQAHADQPYASNTMIEVARQWITQVGGTAPDADPSATSRLSKLEVYITRFNLMRAEFVALADLEAEVWRRIERQSRTFRVERSEVAALQNAEKALERRDFPFPDDDAAQVEVRRKEVERAVVWLGDLLQQANHIANEHDVVADRFLDSPPGGGTPPNPPQPQKVREAVEKFREKGAHLLRVPRRDDTTLFTAAEQVEEAYREILQARAEGGATNDPPPPPRRVGAVPGDLGDGSREVAGDASRPPLIISASAAEGTTLPIRPTPISLDSLERISPKPDGGLDTDDLIEFSATVDLTRPQTLPTYVFWDFGDGSAPARQVVRAGKESETLAIRHRFAAGGEYTVKLTDAGGNPLAMHPLTVSSSPGRSARLLSAFRLTEWPMTLVSGLLTVGAGFLLLYHANPQWGAAQDYLKAFLWGAVLSEGLRYVTGIVTHQGPSA